MRLLFLDVDGVLNPGSNIIKQHTLGNSTLGDKIEFDQDAMKNLKYIIENTGAMIVVSSTYRICESDLANLCRQLLQYDLNIYGVTKRLGGMRHHEVLDYLTTVSKVQTIESYVILDDDSDFMGALRKRLVKTSFNVGLTAQKAKRAVEILNIPF